MRRALEEIRPAQELRIASSSRRRRRTGTSFARLELLQVADAAGVREKEDRRAEMVIKGLLLPHYGHLRAKPLQRLSRLRWLADSAKSQFGSPRAIGAGDSNRSRSGPRGFYKFAIS